MFRLKRQGRPRVTLPLTALIDIVFLLLIYFLLTSSFITREGLKVELPKARSGETIKAPLTVYVDREGEIYFRGQRMSGMALREALYEELTKTSEKRIIIKADRKAPLEAVVSAMDMARLAGAETLSLATEKPEGP